jgi:hypothetical protein
MFPPRTYYIIDNLMKIYKSEVHRTKFCPFSKISHNTLDGFFREEKPSRKDMDTFIQV